jgi:hypothetical protein
VGEHPPRAAGAQDVEDGIQNLAVGMHPRPSPPGGGPGQERLDDPPLRIREIRGIGFACPLGHHTLKVQQMPSLQSNIKTLS